MASRRRGVAGRPGSPTRRPTGGRRRARNHHGQSAAAHRDDRRRRRAVGGDDSRRCRSTAGTSSSWRSSCPATADAALRSDQDQQRADRVGRPDGPRRQHHDRRPGQQRRRRGRTAAEPADRRGAGVPDRHQSLRRRPRALGLVGHQRRDAIGRQHATGHLPRSSRGTAPGRRCRPRSTAADAARRRSIGSRSPAPFGGRCRRDRLFWFAAAEYRHQDGAVLVGARDTATRTITPRLRAGAAEGRLVVAAPRHRRRRQPVHGAIRRGMGQGHGGQRRRARDRIGDAAAGGDEPLPQRAGLLDGGASACLRQRAQRAASARFSTRRSRWRRCRS